MPCCIVTRHPVVTLDGPAGRHHHERPAALDAWIVINPRRRCDALIPVF